MKSVKFKFEVERSRSRAHRILFDNDTPFRPHRVERTDRYNRKDKHKGKQWQNQM